MNTTPDIIEEKVEELVEAVYDHPEIEEETGTEKEAIQNILRNVLTTIHQQGVLSERERIEDEFAKASDYTEETAGDAYGEPINASYYRIYEGKWEKIITPLT